MSSLAADLEFLASLKLHQLRKEWTRHYRSEASSTMSPELLRRAIGYKIQETELGGLSRRAQLRLSSLRSTSGKGKEADRMHAALDLKAGTKLIREWQGKAHEVLALDDGQFAYSGKTYRSLTIIARQITGAHWSGPRFFGLNTARVSADG